MRLRGPVVAILRGGNSAFTVPAARTLIEAGVLAIEITTNTPDWRNSIAQLTSIYGDDAAIGAGTVLTPEHARAAAAAGAAFVVSPHLDHRVGKQAQELGVAWIPGTGTATEAMAAWGAGASAVKIFPAKSLGGPGYLRQILAPLDFIPTMPSGGIEPDDAADYLTAGAFAVGLGGSLIGDSLTTGNLEALRERAGRLTRLIRAATSGSDQRHTIGDPQP